MIYLHKYGRPGSNTQPLESAIRLLTDYAIGPALCLCRLRYNWGRLKITQMQIDNIALTFMMLYLHGWKLKKFQNFEMYAYKIYAFLSLICWLSLDNLIAL